MTDTTPPVKADKLFFKMSPYYDDDESFYDLEHPLSELFWIRGIAYSKRKNTDGFIPDRALRRLSARLGIDDPALLAKDLVQSELWLEVDGGYQYPTWGRWQTTVEDQQEVRRKRSEGGHIKNHNAGRHSNALKDGCPLCVEGASAVLQQCSSTAGEVLSGCSGVPETETETETEKPATSNPKSAPVDNGGKLKTNDQAWAACIAKGWTGPELHQALADIDHDPKIDRPNAVRLHRLRAMATETPPGIYDDCPTCLGDAMVITEDGAEPCPPCQGTGRTTRTQRVNQEAW